MTTWVLLAGLILLGVLLLIGEVTQSRVLTVNAAVGFLFWLYLPLAVPFMQNKKVLWVGATPAIAFVMFYWAIELWEHDAGLEFALLPLARIHRWTRTEGVRTLEGGVRKLQTRWSGLEFG